MVLGQRGFANGTVDGGGPDAPPTARWLAFAAACLLVLAMVSAGVIGFEDGSSDNAVVRAAGTTASTVAAPSTVTVPPPSTVPAASAPSSTIRTTTTLPRAASEVLRAIGTTAPPTTQPAPTTTRAPVTSTTRAPTTTTSTVPGIVTVTVTNAHGHPFLVEVNGRVFDLDPGKTEGPVQLALPATGDDVIEARARGDAACTTRAAADHFRPGGSYKVTVVAGTGPACKDYPSPVIEVSPL
jgi:hypothetical protein